MLNKLIGLMIFGDSEEFGDLRSGKDKLEFILFSNLSVELSTRFFVTVRTTKCPPQKWFWVWLNLSYTDFLQRTTSLNFNNSKSIPQI